MNFLKRSRSSNSASAGTDLSTSLPNDGRRPSSSKTSLISRFSKSSKTSSSQPTSVLDDPSPVGSLSERSEERARALAKLTQAESAASNDNLTIITNVHSSTYTSDSDQASMVSSSTVTQPHRRRHHDKFIKDNELQLVRQMIAELLGSAALQRTSVGAPHFALEQHPSAKGLWLALWDGVLLCRLIKRLLPSSTVLADHRDLPSARKANVARFLEAVQVGFALHLEDLFQSHDLFQGTEEGFAAVLHCLAHVWLQVRDHRMNGRFRMSAADPRPPRSNHISFLEDNSRRSQNLYGLDRRLSESAIDILNPLPEWEEARQYAPPVSPVLKDWNPQWRTNAQESKISDQEHETSGLHRSTTFSTRPTRPPKFKHQSQSLIRSTSVPSPLEVDLLPERVPLRNGRPLSASSVSSVPFPSTPDSTTSPHRRRTQRWNSEVHPMDDSPTRSKGQHFPSSLATTAKRTSFDQKSRQQIIRRDPDGRATHHYRLGEIIGRGQYGTVYKALNLVSTGTVAIKRIRVAGMSDQQINELANEVELLRKCTHLCVVSYQGSLRTSAYLNIIMEYVENGSLLDSLKSYGEFPESVAAPYVGNILEGLHYLHSMDVVHCDLKCANIFTTKSGNIKIGDFGVSMNLNAVQNSPQICGTPCWIAPEVIELHGPSPASDIWSLACTIVEMVSGKPPYADLMSMTAMFRIVEDDMPPIPASCTPELYDFLAQCFAKSPLARPPAEQLFEHPWVLKEWDPHQDFRPKDSIPFLKRISSEVRRLDVASTPPVTPPFHRGGSANHLPRASLDAPETPKPRLSFDLPDNAVENLRSGLVSGDQRSQQLPQPSRLERGTSKTSNGSSAPSSQLSHSLVKTSFSKAVECKLCRSSIKRHGKAFLCEACGLICHASCADSATPHCDLRSSLLNYSTDHSSSTPDLPRARSFGTPAAITLTEVTPVGPAPEFSSDSGSSGSSLSPIFWPHLDSNASLATSIEPSKGGDRLARWSSVSGPKRTHWPARKRKSTGQASGNCILS